MPVNPTSGVRGQSELHETLSQQTETTQAHVCVHPHTTGDIVREIETCMPSLQQLAHTVIPSHTNHSLRDMQLDNIRTMDRALWPT